MVSGIILAGGSSTRYGTGENKTLVELLGRPVLEYSLRVFMAADVVRKRPCESWRRVFACKSR